MLVGALLGLLVVPSAASAAVHTYTERVGPVQVGGYEVKQSFALAPHAPVDGKVTNMEVDVVDADGTPVPIQRLMLHHIVFANLNRPDATCDTIMGFDERPNALFSANERFYAAGEERAKMALPPGYGYELNDTDTWGLLYMFMNHRATTDRAYIQYKYTVNDDPSLTERQALLARRRELPGRPDLQRPRDEGGAAPRYTRERRLRDARIGRIVGGGGHVHGGARKLDAHPARLRQPPDRRVPAHVGQPGPPFYNVRPVLHEPGPIAMSAFQSQAGIPVGAGGAGAAQLPVRQLAAPHPRDGDLDRLRRSRQRRDSELRVAPQRHQDAARAGRPWTDVPGRSRSRSRSPASTRLATRSRSASRRARRSG